MEKPLFNNNQELTAQQYNQIIEGLDDRSFFHISLHRIVREPKDDDGDLELEYGDHIYLQDALLLDCEGYEAYYTGHYLLVPPRYELEDEFDEETQEDEE